jgi:hypothetical protein
VTSAATIREQHLCLALGLSFAPACHVALGQTGTSCRGPKDLEVSTVGTPSSDAYDELGTFFFAHKEFGLYLGELAAGGTCMKPPRRLTHDEAFDLPTAWTPDSKAVLFDSNRNGTFGIFKQGIGQETSEPVVTGPQVASGSRRSADGAQPAERHGTEM